VALAAGDGEGGVADGERAGAALDVEVGVVFGDADGAALGAGVGVGAGVGEAVAVGVGVGVIDGVGFSHGAGQRTSIRVAVCPARAFSMLAPGVNLPVATSNNSVLASGL
jgi:hypothetical protein